MASKVKKVTTSTGKTALVKSGSKAEAKYKAQGATFSSDAGEVRAQKDVSKSNTSSRSNADPMTVSENANDLFKAPTITSANTAPTTGITVPTPPPVGNLGTQTQTKMAGLGATAPIDTTTTQTGATPQSTDFQTYLKSIVAPPSTADIYKKAEKEAGVQQKQQLVNQYQSQLNAINAKAQADILSQTGQGRGIPEAIIGGIQAQINKEAAIQSLPIAAQLSAAQDDLESAKDHLNTLFTIRSQDAQNKVNYQNKLVETVYNYANEQQKLALDEKRIKDSQNFQVQMNTLNYAQSLASTAFSNGQPSLATRIMALDSNSPTYAQDVASAAKGIYVAPKSSGTGGGTVEERKTNAISQLQSALTSGQPLKNGNIPIDQNGFVTPEAWNLFINAAPSEGLNRKDFITNFGYLVYKDPENGVPSSYKLTPAEQKLISGELPS